MENQIIINDLIKINNDRIKGYQLAIEESDSSELNMLFNSLIMESKEYINQLTNRLIELGGSKEDVSDSTTTPGKIYRAWMDVKLKFSSTKKSVLESCEFGEDAWRRAYESALDVNLDSETIELISNQYNDESESHRLIKAKRDDLLIED